MARGKKPDWMIEIAQERMDILFNRAEKEYKEHPERSHRYVELARKISKKYNTKIPQVWGRRYCKNCYKFLVPGHNCAVRLINNEINIYCGECGHIMKIPYIREKKLKRRAKIDSYTFKKRDYEWSSFRYDNKYDNVIEEIKRQLKSNPIIKLRFAKNVARNKDDLISNIVEGTKSQLIDVRGNVAVIYKKQSN